MTLAVRAMWQRRIIIVLLALILVAVTFEEDRELTPERIAALGAAAGAVLYTLLEVARRKNGGES